MQQNPFCLAYIAKPSKRLQLFTELKGKFDRESSEFSSGFKLKFMEGSVTGYMTSQMRFYATYMKALEGGAMQMEFNT